MEDPETADDQPRAVAGGLCAECIAERRALDAQEEHSEAAATALEAAAVVVAKATAKILVHSWESPGGRRFDHGGGGFIPPDALATAALCGEAIRELEAARASCERAAGGD